MAESLDFENLVGRYYEPLYQFAFSLTRDEADACDLVQQTFCIWANKGHQLRDTTKVKTWLFTTLHREFLGARRQARALSACGTRIRGGGTSRRVAGYGGPPRRRANACCSLATGRNLSGARRTILFAGLFLQRNRRNSRHPVGHRQITPRPRPWSFASIVDGGNDRTASGKGGFVTRDEAKEILLL